ncbi:MAG: carbamoyltransferase C-terminal domain-containing protein, partial [Desulfovibrionaceae bacterium]|nr:carbamoyltransferase C-terminal domain-containing protein [Desulfovibrionaceae bacterium]
VNSGEYKLMGLAPYGEPVFRERILAEMVDLKDDGSYRLNLEYFDFHTGLTTIGPKFERFFGVPARRPEAAMNPIYADIAASIQAVFNEIIVRLARTAREISGSDRLCYAGGVALNCVANSRVALAKLFKDIWVQPAAGDAGGALGAALYHYYNALRPGSGPRQSQPSYYLGPGFSDQEIKEVLEAHNIPCEHVPDEAELMDRTARMLAEEKVVGWFQGRMEYGPRALGARSILGDPRSPDMQRRMNLSIKYREGFRPFAPAVPAERCKDYFDLDFDSPYMLFVGQVAESRLKDVDEQGLSGLERLGLARSEIPAVTHVDGSARVQTVHRSTNPRFHALLTRFHELTGCAVLVNTSFNVRGEPIVCTPRDAVRCFLATDMDALVIGSFIVDRGQVDLVAAGDVFAEPELVRLGPGEG